MRRKKNSTLLDSGCKGYTLCCEVPQADGVHGGMKQRVCA
jgi:hypothetical protein